MLIRLSTFPFLFFPLLRYLAKTQDTSDVFSPRLVFPYLAITPPEKKKMSTAASQPPPLPHKPVQQLRPVDRLDNTAEAATPLTSTESSTTAVLADHGLTHSEAESLRRNIAEGPSVLCVTTSEGGVLVQWDAKESTLLVAPATAAVAGSWTPAVRLVAKEGTGAVQLILLAASFRVYVDGQRLARVGSPVLVRPSQAVRFAADTTVYSITTASALTASSCTTERPRFLRQGQAQTPQTSPLPRNAVSPSPPSLPPPRVPPAPAARHAFSPPLSVSSAPTLCEASSPPTSSPPQPDDERNAWLDTDRLSWVQRASAVDSLSTVAAYETAEVAVMPTGAAAAAVDAADTADLRAVATGSGDRYTSDYVDSVACAYDEREQGQPAQRQEMSATTTSRSSSGRRARQRPPQHSSFSSLPSADEGQRALSWGTVITVSSPDWAAVAARCGEVNRESAEGAGSERGSSASAFAAAMRSRREMRQQALPPQQQQQRRSAVLDDGLLPRKAPSPRHVFEAQSSCCTSLTTSITGSASPAAAPSGGLRRGSLASADSAVRLKERLRLKQRVAVVPFVVEAFGDTHRYRPLASVSSAVNSSDEERGDTGLTPDSLSDHGALQSHEDGGPWEYPKAADELVTPHTEGIARRALALRPASTPAAKAASFLHDALRRSYDAAADRFTYMHTAGLPERLYTSFMTVTEEVLVNLEQGRPVRRLTSPLLCAGDLFGSFKDLLVVLGSVAHFSHWSMLHRPLVLLGNYVDYGWHSVEVVMLLCSWACLQPGKVHLLRGTHEDPLVNGDYATLGKRCLRYKCRQRFGAKRGVALWTRVNRIFALLPLAAVVDGGIFLVHGGVPQLLPSPIEMGDSEGRAGAKGGGRRGSSGGGGGGSHHSRGGALYSNTSGVPTPTSATSIATALTSHASSQRASVLRAANSLGSASTQGSWRPPSARQVFPSPTAVGYHEAQRGDAGGARRCAAGVFPPSSTLDSSDVSRGLASGFVAAAGETAEKIFGHQLATGSAGDTLALRGSAGLLWYASSSLTSLSTALGGVATDQSAAEGARCSSGAVRLVSRRLHPPAASAGPHPSASQTSGDPSLAGDDGVVYALQDGRARTPLVDWGYESTAPSAASHDAPSALAYREGERPAAAVAVDGASSESSAHRGAAQSTVSTFTSGAAAATTTTNTIKAASQDDGSSTPHHASATAAAAGNLQSTELDFEELLRASSMRGYTFRTLQPGQQPSSTSSNASGGTEAARRCRLLRELVWNRPRDATARLEDAEEKAHVVDGAVQPSWWWPREVQCCHACSSDAAAVAAHHTCCHVFGSWGLIHFLDRFHFSLMVRGAPEDTSEMYGALLAEEGRLLSLLTCTRLQKASLQAAACVVQANSLQLATWGPQGLADSRGQISLSDLPGIRAQREERDQLCRFVHEQVQIRVLDHNQVGPQNRWGVVSAYGEFKRQRALKKRLGGSKHLP